MSAVDLPAPTPSAPGPTGTQAAAQPLGDVGLQQLPDRLSQLTRPVVLTGTVTGQTADGGTRLRTQAGDVVIRLAVTLPAETPITLQIAAGQPPTRATAFLTGPLTAPLTALTAAPGSQQAAAALAALPLPTGAEGPAVTTSLGTLARTAPAAAGPELPQPPAGTVLPGQVLPLPGRGNTASPPQDQPAAPAGGGPDAAPPLVPGSVVAVRVLGPPASAPFPPALPGSVPPEAALPGPPSADLPSADPPARPLQLTGTITGLTATGRPVLTTMLGALALTLPPGTGLPPGTRLAVELGDPRERVVAAPSPPPTEASALPAPGLPALGEALGALNGLDAALAHTLLHTLVPQAGHRLTAALTFFLDQVRRGGGRGWLGEEATRTLQKAGRGDVLSRLDRAFETMGREAAETPPGDWRPFTVPFFDGTAIQRLDLFVRAVHQDDDEAGRTAGKEERSHRFILDLDLSRFGSLQLDGLVKPRRFDLILRSQGPLPDDLRGTLLAVFSNSLGAVDYSGSLSFQPGSRGWVKPAPRPGGRPGQAVVA